MSVVSINRSKEEKRKYLPLEIRMKMYDDVIELRKQGLTQKEVQKRIYEKYGLRLPQSTISTWINKKHNPFGNVNKFNNSPSPELAYVIGAILGDGNKCFNNKQYFLRLAVNDKEFAEAFGQNLAKVLRRNKPYRTFWNKNLKQWITTGCSILLYKSLDKPLEELKTYIEYSKDTVAFFLRALFDGEGSMHKYRRELMLYNTNEELLNYVKYLLLEYFNIDSTGPHLKEKSGRTKHFPKDRIAKTKKDYYYLYIRANSLLNFYKYIGFTIKRKQQKLIKAIKQ